MKKNRILVIATLVLVLFVAAIGGTIAWLTDTTDTVTNTFTPSDVDIDLIETTGDEYKMVPGATIEKNPTVKVFADSEACWLFVKIEKSTDKNFDDYMAFEIADGWTALPGVDGVYYRAVADTDAEQTFAVLKDNKVTVKDGVTKAMMDAVNESNKPTLSFTAYAIQKANSNGEFEVADAWAAISTPAA